MKTKAVAAYAQGVEPIDSNILAMTKQKHRPPADIMRDARRPNRSMLQSGIIDPTRYVRDVHPPRMSERFRDRCMAFWYTTGA
jgi:hypothetical protein